MMMNIKSCISRGIFVTVLAAASLLLTGCVDQHPEGTKTTAQTETVESMLEITDPVEKQAVEVAKAKVRSMEESPKIVATSPAVADICDKLELDLVGVCSSSISTIPERYKDVTTVGTAMSPDMEIVASLKPDWILSPISLQSDLEPKYENIGVDWAFLNLRSVQGMYRSIQELGEIFDREEQADKLVKEIFGVKSGETVIITADDDSDASVVEAVKNSAKNAGAHAMVISVPTPGGVGKAADPDLPVDALSAALLCADVWIEFNHQWLLYSTPFERAEAENKKMRYMCLVDFNPDLMIRTIGNVETEQLKKFMLAITEKTKNAKNMRVTTPAGCDISFEIDPGHYTACDCGNATVPGIHMLTGQINVVPRFGSINGVIVFDGSVTPPFGTTPDAPIRLTIENSKIVKIEGGRDAAIFEEHLKSFEDEGMFKLAHIAYGFNPGAVLTGNIVEDERVWGSTEWDMSVRLMHRHMDRMQNLIVMVSV